MSNIIPENDVQMKFVIMHEVVARHDAIGNDIEGMYLILNERYLCRVYAISGKNDRVTYISEQELDQWMEESETVIIYHHSVYWEHGHQKIKRFKGRIIFRYHNITPEHFLEPYNERYYLTCKRGREQTLRLINEYPAAYWLSDSTYNSDELDLYDHTKKEVCPPFNKIADWAEVKPNETVLRKLQETDALNILFVGRIVPNKGHLKMLEVVRIYSHCYQENVHLRIVGKKDDALWDYSDLIEEQMRAYQIDSMVEFIGEIDDSTLMSYYMGSDAMLCCSEHEGFFVPGIEAQSFELPVIAFRTCAVPETLGDHQLLLDLDAYQCAAALRFIHKNAEAKDYFTRAGTRNYRNRFTQKVIRKQFTGALKKMIGVEL